ncbi:MAG: transposase [Nitrospiraceae bacterium]|nr:transposase [Nitrospiraceae bacterium]
MSNTFWIGCDISKQTFWVALAKVGDPGVDWTKLPHHEFEHSQDGVAAFLHWLEEFEIGTQEVAGICLESTGRFSLQWATLLEENLGSVSIVNPAAPKAFGTSLGIRDKSDRVDACVCALFGRTRRPKPTTFRSHKAQDLCEQFRLYLVLDSERIAHEQRLEDGPSSEAVCDILRNAIDALKEQIAKVESAMADTIKDDPQLSQDAKQAQTVSGIGPKAVRAILGEFGDLREYKRNELVALAGLFPKEFTSGTSVHRKPRLAKGGGGRVRKILYMCAMSARIHNPHVKKFADRLEKNGKRPMQILGAIMRKLLLLVRAVIISGVPYDPEYGFAVESEPT